MNYPGTIPAAVARYLSCGDSDPESRVWPGGYYDRHVLAQRELRAALVAEVRRRVVNVVPVEPPDVSFTSSQRRIELMVRGLFPVAEQEIVLNRLRDSVVLITHANIDALLESLMWDCTAWVIANMYLRSLGLDTLGGDDSTPVGMSEETTCYVTPECLVEADPFADFVVHEAAHIFHNCKRGTLGLRQTRTREWLLDIDFHERETFAYSCEAYSRVIDGAADRRERLRRAEAFAQGHCFPVHAVDMPKVIDIVRAAAASRSGWKLILARSATLGISVSPHSVVVGYLRRPVAMLLALCVVGLIVWVAAVDALFIWLTGTQPLSVGNFWMLGILLALVLGATGYQWWRLSRDGSEVAHMLGGTPVSQDPSDPKLRRLRQVLDEMAIAAAMPAKLSGR